MPTGTVTITVDGATWGTVTLDPNGNGYLVAGAVPTSSCLYDYIFSQGPLLTGGTHTIGASYSGDATFSPATATPVVVTVAPLTVTPTLAAGQTFIAAGTADQLTATFATISALTGTTSGIAGPTGTVTFTDTTTSTVLGTASVNDIVAFSGNTYTYSANSVLNTTGITTTGANTITASYSGDANFAATTSAVATVTVGTGTATSVAVTSSANPTTLGGRPTFTATLTGGPTSGTVTFYDGTTVLGTGTVGTAHTATLRLGTTPAFTGGTHNITAAFGGVSGTYTSSVSPVLVETVTQGTAPITLTAKNSGTVGKTFTFAAVLTPSSTSATYSPNQGVVKFYDGSTLLGSAQPITVTSTQGGYGLWTATFGTTSLTAGTHTITATYSDVNYSLTTSAAATVKVYSAPQGNLDLAVDNVTATSTVSQADLVYIAGWTADAVDGSPMSNVTVYIDGVSQGTPTLNVTRNDVASYYNNAGFTQSGFYMAVPASGLSVGPHTVTFTSIDTGGYSSTFGPLTINVVAASKPPAGALDLAVDDHTATSIVSQADKLYTQGWAADFQTNGPVASVEITVDGQPFAAATLGVARADVASYYNNPSWSNTGYVSDVSAATLALGPHTVSAYATDHTGLVTNFGTYNITVVP